MFLFGREGGRGGGRQKTSRSSSECSEDGFKPTTILFPLLQAAGLETGARACALFPVGWFIYSPDGLV